MAGRVAQDRPAQEVTIVDSWLRCPWDGKKLVFESYTEADGEGLNVHECWNCGYRTVT